MSQMRNLTGTTVSIASSNDEWWTRAPSVLKSRYHFDFNMDDYLEWQNSAAILNRHFLL